MSKSFPRSTCRQLKSRNPSLRFRLVFGCRLSPRTSVRVAVEVVKGNGGGGGSSFSNSSPPKPRQPSPASLFTEVEEDVDRKRMRSMITLLEQLEQGRFSGGFSGQNVRQVPLALLRPLLNQLIGVFTNDPSEALAPEPVCEKKSRSASNNEQKRAGRTNRGLLCGRGRPASRREKEVRRRSWGRDWSRVTGRDQYD